MRVHDSLGGLRMSDVASISPASPTRSEPRALGSIGVPPVNRSEGQRPSTKTPRWRLGLGSKPRASALGSEQPPPELSWTSAMPSRDEVAGKHIVIRKDMPTRAPLVKAVHPELHCRGRSPRRGSPQGWYDPR